MPCIPTRLCAVSLRPPARSEAKISLAEYYAQRVGSPWPLGFPSLACYEAAVADGQLLLTYAKDVDLEDKKTKPRRGKHLAKKQEVY